MRILKIISIQIIINLYISSYSSKFYKRLRCSIRKKNKKFKMQFNKDRNPAYKPPARKNKTNSPRQDQAKMARYDPVVFQTNFQTILQNQYVRLTKSCIQSQYNIYIRNGRPVNGNRFYTNFFTKPVYYLNWLVSL